MPVDLLVPAGDIVGESPRWDHRRDALVWIDAARPVVHVYEPASGSALDRPLPRLVSSIALRASGGYLVTADDGVWELDADFAMGECLATFAPIPAGYYVNDSGVDPSGALWVGVGGDDPEGRAGRVDRVTAEGAVTPVLRGLALPNGIGWSPSGETMYLCDSGTATIRAYAFEATTGAVGAGRVVHRAGVDDGLPDGLAVAADGSLLVAFWGGARLRRLAPDGEVLDELVVPVVQPAAVCLGGAGWTDGYVTSATHGLTDPGEADGGLLRFASPIAGRPPSGCRL